MADSLLDRWQAQDKPTRENPLRAIRLKCLDCCGNQSAEVRECPVYLCPLWPYRMGHRGLPPGSWLSPANP